MLPFGISFSVVLSSYVSFAAFVGCNDTRLYVSVLGTYGQVAYEHSQEVSCR